MSLQEQANLSYNRAGVGPDPVSGLEGYVDIFADAAQETLNKLAALEGGALEDNLVYGAFVSNISADYQMLPADPILSVLTATVPGLTVRLPVANDATVPLVVGKPWQVYNAGGEPFGVALSDGSALANLLQGELLEAIPTTNTSSVGTWVWTVRVRKATAAEVAAKTGNGYVTAAQLGGVSAAPFGCELISESSTLLRLRPAWPGGGVYVQGIFYQLPAAGITADASVVVANVNFVVYVGWTGTELELKLHADDYVYDTDFNHLVRAANSAETPVGAVRGVAVGEMATRAYTAGVVATMPFRSLFNEQPFSLAFENDNNLSVPVTGGWSIVPGVMVTALMLNLEVWTMALHGGVENPGTNPYDLAISLDGGVGKGNNSGTAFQNLTKFPHAVIKPWHQGSNIRFGTFQAQIAGPSGTAVFGKSHTSGGTSAKGMLQLANLQRAY